MHKQSLLFFLSILFCTVVLAQKNNNKLYIDRKNIDFNVKPGDNFFLYANGNWLKNNPVPASKTRWGSFEKLAEMSSERLKNLAQDAAANRTKNSVNQMVGDFYVSGMDSAAIEKAGYKPIQADLKRIESIQSEDQIFEEIATLRQKGAGSPLFGFFIGQDNKDVTNYIPRLSQGGTTLPDRDYYISENARMKEIRKEYQKYLADMFRLTGNAQQLAHQKAEAVLAIETALAKLQMSRVEMRDPKATYNKFSLADLNKLTPGIDWKQLFTWLKIDKPDSILVNNPAFFKGADALFNALPIQYQKAYLEWSVIKSSAPYLSSDFVNRQFAFDRILTGQKELTPRWQRMSTLTDRSLGDLIGQLYVEKYFTQAAKERMLDLVDNVQQTFAERIQKLDWMSDSTKERALEKLHAIVNKIGFPDKWETYPGVTISSSNLHGNMESIARFQYNKMINKLGKPVDKTEWGMTPPTVNAYYSPVNNEIAFPAGILQFPFFDFGADDAVNYGGAAAVIGHELTHGFDDSGRQYAADGNLHDWWTSSDAEKFTSLAQKVIDQYNAYTVNDSIHVNGKLTLGENLADLGGLSIAYEAFKKTPQGKSTKKIDGFTPDQRFFLSWAQVWSSNILPEAAAQRILTDSHSPAMYRTNGPVSNMDSWYEAFDVKPGDALYKPKSERITVW